MTGRKAAPARTPRGQPLPLAEETVVAGSGSVDLFITSNLGDTDLEATITEIRPDGQEVYVQSGWLRASQRALDETESTVLRPVHTHREEDAAPLPDGQFEEVRVELFPFAHVFRAGSRIRLIVDAPGGNRPVWEFDTIAGGEQVTIAEGPLERRSSCSPSSTRSTPLTSIPLATHCAVNPAGPTPAVDRQQDQGPWWVQPC